MKPQEQIIHDICTNTQRERSGRSALHLRDFVCSPAVIKKELAYSKVLPDTLPHAGAGQLGEPIRILRSKHGIFYFSTRAENSELPPFTYDAKITDFAFHSEIACLAGLNKTQLAKKFKLSTAEGSAEISTVKAFGDADKEVLFFMNSMPGFSTWRSKVTS